jgi:hypothetical protein
MLATASLALTGAVFAMSLHILERPTDEYVPPNPSNGKWITEQAWGPEDMEPVPWFLEQDFTLAFAPPPAQTTEKTVGASPPTRLFAP